METHGNTVKSGQVEKLYSGDQDGAVAQDMKNLDTTGDVWHGNIELSFILQGSLKYLFWGIKHWTCMVILRDFPYTSALFRLVI